MGTGGVDMNYRTFDIEHWERKEHYEYYTKQLKVSYSITNPVDVTGLLSWCHKTEHKFYPMLIYHVTRVVNHLEFLRMFRKEDGTLCVWDELSPNYTIFHKDDHTFSDCWTEYEEDMDAFYEKITKDMDVYGRKKGVKVKEGQPGNFYCISAVPWIGYTGYATNNMSGEPNFFPIITAGKYEGNDGKVKMPVTLTIAHAVCDGYHAGVFFETLQKELDKYKI